MSSDSENKRYGQFTCEPDPELLWRLKARREALEMAMDFFEDESEARDWLNEPAHYFHGKKPIDVASESPEGLNEVLVLLNRLEHGVIT